MTVQVNGTTGVSLVQDGTVTPSKTSGMRDLVQIQTYATGAFMTGTTLIPADNTIPQITEGDQYMQLSITPTNVNSLLEIDVLFQGTPSTAAWTIVALFQDSNVNSLATNMFYEPGGSQGNSCSIKFIMTANTTSTTTFKVRAGLSTAGTLSMNGNAGGAYFGGMMASRITIKEYQP